MNPLPKNYWTQFRLSQSRGRHILNRRIFSMENNFSAKEKAFGGKELRGNCRHFRKRRCGENHHICKCRNRSCKAGQKSMPDRHRYRTAQSGCCDGIGEQIVYNLVDVVEGQLPGKAGSHPGQASSGTVSDAPLRRPGTSRLCRRGRWLR